MSTVPIPSGSILISSVGFGLVTASILALGAVGFTLQFGITNVFNLAYAQVMTICAYVAYACNHAGLNIWLAMVVAAFAGAALSVGLNRGIFTPFTRRLRRIYETLVVTLAVGIILENVLLALVGPSFVGYSANPGATVHVGSIILTAQQLAIMGLAIVAMASIHTLLKRTKIGKAMRATAGNPALARSCGIDTSRVVDVAWAISGMLCGIAGVMIAVNLNAFTTTTEDGILVLIVSAAVLGGVGLPYGAMLGAVIVGLITEMAAAVFNPLYKDVAALVILVAVLLLRPQGLLGGRESRAVTR